VVIQEILASEYIARNRTTSGSQPPTELLIIYFSKDSTCSPKRTIDPNPDL
jgi:hypothetical protein